MTQRDEGFRGLHRRPDPSNRPSNGQGRATAHQPGPSHLRLPTPPDRLSPEYPPHKKVPPRLATLFRCLQGLMYYLQDSACVPLAHVYILYTWGLLEDRCWRVSGRNIRRPETPLVGGSTC